MQSVILVARWTFAELRKNRWLLFISCIFSVIVIGLALAGNRSMEGIASFDRLSASMLTIILLFVPLVGFLLGAQTVAGDRENGGLVYLLSHPIRKSSIFLGKLLGAFLLIACAFSIGFGVAGLFVAFFTFQGLTSFLMLWFFTLFFSLMCLSIGFCISAIVGNRVRALGVGIFAWLLFTILGDLGLLGTSFMLNLSGRHVFALVLINPMQTFKVLLIKLLASNLEVLGATGIYFDLTLGKELVPFLSLWLLLVTMFFLLAGLWLFVRHEEA